MPRAFGFGDPRPNRDERHRLLPLAHGLAFGAEETGQKRARGDPGRARCVFRGRTLKRAAKLRAERRAQARRRLALDGGSVFFFSRVVFGFVARAFGVRGEQLDSVPGVAPRGREPVLREVRPGRALSFGVRQRDLLARRDAFNRDELEPRRVLAPRRRRAGRLHALAPVIRVRRASLRVVRQVDERHDRARGEGRPRAAHLARQKHARPNERQSPRRDGARDVGMLFFFVVFAARRSARRLFLAFLRDRVQEVGHERGDARALHERVLRQARVLEAVELAVGDQERQREALGRRHHAAVARPERASVARDGVHDRARQDALPGLAGVGRRRGDPRAHARPRPVGRQRHARAILHAQRQGPRHGQQHLTDRHVARGEQPPAAVFGLAELERGVHAHVVRLRERQKPRVEARSSFVVAHRTLRCPRCVRVALRG